MAATFFLNETTTDFTSAASETVEKPQSDFIATLASSGHFEDGPSTSETSKEAEPSTSSKQEQYIPSWFTENSSKPLLLDAADEMLEDFDDEKVTPTTTSIPSIPTSSLRTARLLQSEQPSAQSSKSPVPAAPVKWMSCKMCEMVIYSRAELNNHFITDHGYVRCRLFPTGVCSTVLANKRGEADHFRRLHKPKPTKKIAGPPPKRALTFSMPPGSLNPVQRFFQNHGFLTFSGRSSEPPQKRGRFDGTEGEESAALG